MLSRILLFIRASFVLVPLAAVYGYWYWPKPMLLSKYGVTGYYRGLGLTDEGGFFGKRFVRMTGGYDGREYWHVEHPRLGYNSYQAFYPDGNLRANGELFIENHKGTCGPIVPNFENVRNCRYYKPDGSLGSEVVNGTGTATYWNPEGTKIFESEFLEYKYVRWECWHDNGKPWQMMPFVDGERHGKTKVLWEDGTVQEECEYANGEPVGKWLYYNADGNVDMVTDYGTDPPTVTHVSQQSTLDGKPVSAFP